MNATLSKNPGPQKVSSSDGQLTGNLYFGGPGWKYRTLSYLFDGRVRRVRVKRNETPEEILDKARAAMQDSGNGRFLTPRQQEDALKAVRLLPDGVSLEAAVRLALPQIKKAMEKPAPRGKGIFTATLPSRNAAKVSLGDAFECFLNDSVAWGKFSHDTAITYRSRFRKLLDEFRGIPLSEFSSGHLEHFCAERYNCFGVLPDDKDDEIVERVAGVLRVASRFWDYCDANMDNAPGFAVYRSGGRVWVLEKARGILTAARRPGGRLDEYGENAPPAAVEAARRRRRGTRGKP